MLCNLNKKIIQGALAGKADAEFCSNITKSKLFRGLTIGGFSIGSNLLSVAQKMTQSGRNEYLWTINEAVSQIETILKNVDQKTMIFVNIRTNNTVEFKEFLQKLSFNLKDNINSKESIIMELNAHCQQKELVQAGTGSALLEKDNILSELIHITKKEDFCSSVKVRISTNEEYQKVKKIFKYKPDIIHADSYLKGELGHHYSWIEELRTDYDGFIIANNSLYDYESIIKSFKNADAVSLARPFLKSEWKENLSTLRNFNQKL